MEQSFESDKVDHKVGMTEYDFPTSHDLLFQNGLFGVAMTLTNSLKISLIYVERIVSSRIMVLNNRQCNIGKLAIIFFCIVNLCLSKQCLSVVHSRHYKKDC